MESVQMEGEADEANKVQPIKMGKSEECDSREAKQKNVFQGAVVHWPHNQFCAFGSLKVAVKFMMIVMVESKYRNYKERGKRKVVA